MGQKSKRVREMDKLVDATKVYSVNDAIAILKKSPPVKFEQSVEISLRLGIDPRQSNQNVRGTVALPKGSGKTLRILVFAKGDKAHDAEQAGADFVGSQELVDKVAGGWTDFDAVIATPDMMREVGKLGKVLGPRGLMPTPKAGTVTTDVTTAIRELKAGKIEFKSDRHGVVNSLVGKLNFAAENIAENITSFIAAVVRAKPPTAKGQYVKGVCLSSTMGPGMKIDMRELDLS
ncbi:MAG: 50S ribosomal protein L1 [Parachlamydiales bacterium]|jgi:large subunit ribosomal protein L1